MLRDVQRRDPRARALYSGLKWVSHITTAKTGHATSGEAIRRTTLEWSTGRIRRCLAHGLATRRRSVTGAPSARSGGATIVSNRCWTMCTVRRSAAYTSTADTSATRMAAKPGEPGGHPPAGNRYPRMGPVHLPNGDQVAAGRHERCSPRHGIEGPGGERAERGRLRSHDPVCQGIPGRHRHQRGQAKAAHGQPEDRAHEVHGTSAAVAGKAFVAAEVVRGSVYALPTPVIPARSSGPIPRSHAPVARTSAGHPDRGTVPDPRRQDGAGGHALRARHRGRAARLDDRRTACLGDRRRRSPLRRPRRGRPSTRRSRSVPRPCSSASPRPVASCRPTGARPSWLPSTPGSTS